MASWLVWSVMVAVAVVIAANAWHAFPGPWVWNADQIVFALIWLFLAFVAAFYFPIWQRGGIKALKAKFAAMPDPGRRRGPVFWVVIVAVLVLAFLSDPENRELLMNRLQ